MNSNNQWTPQRVRILETYRKERVQQPMEMFPTHVIGLLVEMASQIEVLKCPKEIFFHFTAALTHSLLLFAPFCSFLVLFAFFFLLAQLHDSGTEAYSLSV